MPSNLMALAERVEGARRERPMLAFAVTEEDEGTGGIVFARHAIVARREGANEYAGGEFDYVSCRRASWADHCAESRVVPASLMIEHGWHFECGGCGNRIDEDYLAERDLRLEDVQGFQHTSVHCSPLCEARHNLRRAEAKYRETRWIRRFEKIIKRRFPDATIIRSSDHCKPHAYATQDRDGKWRIEQVIVSFNWPGQDIGPACLRIDTRTEWPRNGKSFHKRSKPYWTCCTGDRAAFEAYAEAAALKARASQVIAGEES